MKKEHKSEGSPNQTFWWVMAGIQASALYSFTDVEAVLAGDWAQIGFAVVVTLGVIGCLIRAVNDGEIPGSSFYSS